MQNGKFKKKRVYYSQVSNCALRDKNLSMKAKGLFGLIQSYITIENFTLYKAMLFNQCCEGKKAFENTWKELKEKGYLIQEKHQNSNGTYYYEYDLLDTSACETTSMREHEGDTASIHTPQKEDMDKGGYGKGGSIIKTLENKMVSNKNEEGKGADAPWISLPKDDYTKLMQRYIEEYYPKYQGLDHPELTEKQLNKIYNNLVEFCKDHTLRFYDLIGLAEKFLNNSNLSTDYNILHFTTKGILENRLHEYERDSKAKQGKKLSSLGLLKNKYNAALSEEQESDIEDLYFDPFKHTEQKKDHEKNISEL